MNGDWSIIVLSSFLLSKSPNYVQEMRTSEITNKKKKAGIDADIGDYLIPSSSMR